MNSNLRSISHDAEFDQMEQEIRAYYRKERLEDAAWTATICACLAAIVVILVWVR